MKEIIFACLLLVFLSGCVKEESKSIVYSEAPSTIQEVVNKDEKRKQIADLPIQFHPGGKLIHILGEVHYNESYKKFEGFSSGSSEADFNVSHGFGNEISGEIDALVFQDSDSDHLQPLTREKVKIFDINFLESLYEKNGKDYILYELIDQDSNQDQLWNGEDVSSLYLSRGDGSGFMKLSNEQEEILSWKFLPVPERIYFKTMADSNKDGKFDLKDQLSYHYVDLSGEKPIRHSYDPFSEPKTEKQAT